MKQIRENDHTRTTAATVNENRQSEENEAKMEQKIKEQEAANKHWANIEDEEGTIKGMELLDSSQILDIELSQIANSETELTQHFSQEGKSKEGLQDKNSGEDFFSTEENNSQLVTLAEVTTNSQIILSQSYEVNSQKEATESTGPQRGEPSSNQGRQIEIRELKGWQVWLGSVFSQF